MGDSIIRRSQASAFTPISRELLQDSTLSFGCRGLLGYLLSKPEGWEVRVSDIEREGGIGSDARRTLMQEAERAGYLTSHVTRAANGQCSTFYTLYEIPVSVDRRTRTAKSKHTRTTKFAGQSAKSGPSPEELPFHSINLDSTQDTAEPAGGWAAQMAQEIVGVQLSIHVENEIARANITDQDTWRETLEYWRINQYKSTNLAGMFSAYNQKIQRRQDEQNRRHSYSTKEKSGQTTAGGRNARALLDFIAQS